MSVTKRPVGEIVADGCEVSSGTDGEGAVFAHETSRTQVTSPIIRAQEDPVQAEPFDLERSRHGEACGGGLAV